MRAFLASRSAKSGVPGAKSSSAAGAVDSAARLSYARDGQDEKALSLQVDNERKTRPKVVYVAGYGRSGSTLMSIALQQHPRIFGAGEIHELTRSAWEMNTYCSCGQSLHQCEFWSGVVAAWASGSTPDFFQRYRGRQTRFENVVSVPFARLGALGGAALSSFVSQTEDLFRLIGEASGCEVMVDSSKLPGRAAALAASERIDLHVIHLVRDGRGVAWSLMKGYERDVKAGLQRKLKPKSALRTAARWSMMNLAAEDLRRVVGPDRYVRIRYEDFASDPAAALGRVGEVIGMDLVDIGARLARGGAVGPGHQIAGNRLRMNDSIKLTPDESWRSEMPAGARRAFEAACGWLLNRYDYRTSA